MLPQVARFRLTVLLLTVAVAAQLAACVSGRTGEVAPSPPDAPTSAATSASDEDLHTKRRRQMVDEQIRARGVSDERVLTVMESVPRQMFVPEEYQAQAYSDRPLPIGYGQTISQPYIVAVMTELLQVGPDSVVLEIGTGSGYQAAILSPLVAQVYTIEIVEPLCEQAKERLSRLGYGNVTVRCDDGYFGWADHAPFDGIMVTAAPDHIPQPLVNQLADGGRMVIPVGPPGAYQTLWLLQREGEEVRSERVMGVVFVPLTRR